MSKKCKDCIVGHEFFPNEGSILLGERDVQLRRQTMAKDEFDEWINGRNEWYEFSFFNFCPECGCPIERKRLMKYDSNEEDKQ